MARKESITRDIIVEIAFGMVREEGFEQVTARKLAAKIGCSTQPIFRIYENMAELYEVLFDKAIAFFHQYYEEYHGNHMTPFVNLGMAYIAFAKDEPKVFHLLFLSPNRGERTLYEMVNGENGLLVKEINKAAEMHCKSPGELFMKMWIFIHGAACMVITDDYDLEDNETLAQLRGAYAAFR